MPVTALDDRPALIVVDLQRGTTRNPTVHPIADIIANASALARSFRAGGLPVALATYDLGAATPGRSDMGTWSCFASTPLHALLQERAVTQVVISGIATSFGVESTARHAYDLGYNVVLATDAMTDLRAEAHDNSVSRIFPVLGETGTTCDILALAQRR